MESGPPLDEEQRALLSDVPQNSSSLEITAGDPGLSALDGTTGH
jgi:hypothetical protein